MVTKAPAIDGQRLYEPHQLPRPWDLQLLDLGDGEWKLSMQGRWGVFTWDRLILMLATLMVESGGPDCEPGFVGDGCEEEYALALAITLMARHRTTNPDGDFVYALGTDETWSMIDGIATPADMRRCNRQELARALWRRRAIFKSAGAIRLF